MNIVFMGTPQFAIPSLEAICKSSHNVCAVVTAPDKPKGRGLKLSESAVKQFAVQNSLTLLQPLNLKDKEFIASLKKIEPDLIVIVAFRVLPAEVFTLPKFGSINLHASMLPKYRGAAPINRAIINCENQTGVTTFFLKEKVDTGNLILQKALPIENDDNAGTLHDKLMLLGAELIIETLDLIESKNGNIQVIEQEQSKSTPAPKIYKEDCRILWNVPAINIHNLVRGLSPYPAAFSIFKNKIIKIYKTIITDIESIGDNGEIIVIKNDMFVSCSDYLIKIEELQPEGKRRMTAREFLAGNRIEKSDKFIY